VISERGMMGEREISIKPGTSSEILDTSQIIQGYYNVGFNETISQIGVTIKNINALSGTLEELIDDKDQMRTIKDVIQNLNALLLNMNHIFEKNKDTNTVQNFLMDGKSAYRLPDKISRDNVHEYYTEELPNLGWENILSVPIGSEDKKYGEYWVKENQGLRIYVKENSVWYETITTMEASSGLEDDVKEEIERELLLASSETQDLLPDFPWVLPVPKEYIISYHSSELENFREVSFKKIGSNHIYSLTPVGYFGGNTFDSYLYTYIDSKKIDDKNLAKLWVTAREAMQSIQEYLHDTN